MTRVLKTLLVVGLAATLFVLGQTPPDSVEPAPTGVPGVATNDNVTFVYLHGFGGPREDPRFCQNMREFLKESGSTSKVINYEWDSVKVNPLRAGQRWIQAQENADKEAPRFAREVIEPLERSGDPYVIVGFSVGSRVVLRALESIDEPLTGLQAVYFLGSAMTKETTLKSRAALPAGLKITNYHSPHRDVVHKVSFNFMSASEAGGRVGFDDEEVFENVAVACAHAHKGGLSIDYSGLAEAIAYLELWDRGVVRPGKTKINLETSVMEGDFWWNKLRRIEVPDPQGGTMLVEFEQHNTRPGYYRALRIREDGERSRVARGENLHAIMMALGASGEE